MRDFRDAKAMAQTLRDALKSKSISISHSESLELIAKALGVSDWNVLSAAIGASQPAPGQFPRPAVTGKSVIPVTPMRDVVFFPQLIAPIFVGRDKTRRALASATASDSRIFVVTQRRSDDDDPDFAALYPVGVVADIIRYAELPNGNLSVKVSCIGRATVLQPVERDFLAAEVTPLSETRATDPEAFALTQELLVAFERLTNRAPPQSLYRCAGEPGVLADLAAQLLELDIERTQHVLETSDVVARLRTLLAWMKPPVDGT